MYCLTALTCTWLCIFAANDQLAMMHKGRGCLVSTLHPCKHNWRKGLLLFQYCTVRQSCPFLRKETFKECTASCFLLACWLLLAVKGELFNQKLSWPLEYYCPWVHKFLLVVLSFVSWPVWMQVSVIGQQRGSAVGPYQTDAGDILELLYEGVHSAEVGDMVLFIHFTYLAFSVSAFHAWSTSFLGRKELFKMLL